ncbi:hypothetical protein BC827DRAFT_1136777 [Russula dissimulans]|nr:hypothetical protein BC827DRAFT_1136777 [Russula dissimulans]
MRILFALFAVSALSLPVWADHSLRQHVEPRALIDVCATITSEDLASVDLVLPQSSYYGCIDICICLSSLSATINTNTDLQLLVKTYGENPVKADLSSLITGCANSQRCRYPDHSEPACSPENPCDFNCISPYVRRGNQCVCGYPHTLCNGVCGVFQYGCGSAVPLQQRRGNTNLRARSRGIFTHEDALLTCDRGEQVCGVDKGSAAFECLNTNTALESCEWAIIHFRVDFHPLSLHFSGGGCVSPNPFLLISEQGPEGVDCTTLPHVQNVRCSTGSCLVESCVDGYVPSADYGACIRDGFFIQTAHFH